MKVLFIFGGLPHYYNAILNRLNNFSTLEISVVVPKFKSTSIGEGVYQTKKDINFKVIELEETSSFYNKPYFPSLFQTIKDENPDTIVIIWPYVLMLFFNSKFKRIINEKNIKLLYKGIPFRIPKFQDAFKWSGEKFFDENMNYREHRGFFPFLNRSILGLIRKYYLNKMDAHVYYTEDSFEIITTYGVEKEKIFVIYNSPDTNQLFETKKKLNSENVEIQLIPNRIIHVGRLVKWKRVDLLIKAVNILKNDFSEIELLIIGSGPEEDNLKDLTKRLSLNSNIKFIGAVYKSDMLAKYMISSAIYVLAGMGGLSINEAMAFGKPVICSVCDGTEKKLVRDGFNGYYFKEGDKYDLANKIKLLLSNQNEILRMGKNSETIIRDEINIDTVINGYIKAFEYVSDKRIKL